MGSVTFTLLRVQDWPRGKEEVTSLLRTPRNQESWPHVLHAWWELTDSAQEGAGAAAVMQKAWFLPGESVTKTSVHPVLLVTTGSQILMGAAGDRHLEQLRRGASAQAQGICSGCPRGSCRGRKEMSARGLLLQPAQCWGVQEGSQGSRG